MTRLRITADTLLISLYSHSLTGVSHLDDTRQLNIVRFCVINTWWAC